MAGELLAPLPPQRHDVMTSMQVAVLDIMCSTSAVDITAGREHSRRNLDATFSDGLHVVLVEAI